MSGAAQRGMNSVTHFTFEPVTGRQAIAFHVPDNRLDHLAALEQLLEFGWQRAGMADETSTDMLIQPRELTRPAKS